MGFKPFLTFVILCAVSAFCSCNNDSPETTEVEKAVNSFLQAVNSGDTVAAKKFLVTKSDITARNYDMYRDKWHSNYVDRFMQNNQDVGRLKGYHVAKVKTGASSFVYTKTGRFKQGLSDPALLDVPKEKEFELMDGKMKLLEGDGPASVMYKAEVTAINFGDGWKVLRFDKFESMGSQNWSEENLKVSNAYGLWFYLGALVWFIAGYGGKRTLRSITGYTASGTRFEGTIDDGPVEGTDGPVGGISMALSWVSIYIVLVFISQIIYEKPFPDGAEGWPYVVGFVAFIPLWYLFIWLINSKFKATKIILAIWGVVLVVLSLL